MKQEIALPMILASLLPLFAQVGPGGALPQAPLEIPKRRTEVGTPTETPAAPRLRLTIKWCFALAKADPASALTFANEVLAGEDEPDRSTALACKAISLIGLEQWDEARTAFVAASDALPQSDFDGRSEMEGGAAIAAESSNEFGLAIEHYDRALELARQGNNSELVGKIFRDRANSLFKLGRKDEAAASLADARTALPSDPTTFVISARAARLLGKLSEAQSHIEKAAALAPTDPEIGLEAGVIAVLGGRDEAARRSWQSVIAMTPDSQAAKTARGYLDQLGPQPQSEGR